MGDGERPHGARAPNSMCSPGEPRQWRQGNKRNYCPAALHSAPAILVLVVA